MRIGVIGTGVAGSLFTAAAVGLDGVEVQAFDRIRPSDREEAGTGLNIGPNAMRALRRQGGLDRVIDDLWGASLPWRRWTIDLTDGTRLIDLDLLEVADGPGLRIRWADLYRVLRSAAAGATTYDRSIEAIEEDSAGRLIPVLCDSNGALHREGPFDLLVAADGRYSQTRALVAGKPEPRFPGIGTWRLLVRGAADCPIDDYGQYFCGNARLLSFKVPGDDVYVAGSFPLPGDGPMPEAMRTAEAQLSFFLPPGRAPSPQVAWMLMMVEKHIDEMNWARTQEIDPLHQAMDGRVLLLGDADHAMFQTLGQGATQSMEDSLVAAAVLRDGARAPAEISRAYEAKRQDRVAFAAQFTREATDTMLPGGDPVTGSLAKAQAPFLEKLRKLYQDVA